MAQAATHPAKIGRYEIRAELGRGMMGVVYRALDPHLEREVALKAVRLAFLVSEQEGQAFEKRFLAEARAVAALSHPAIVVVHDFGRDAETGTLYIALEYLQGQTLAQRLADGPPLDWRETVRLIAQVADALHHAHARGIVHRDIKPANIMVLPSGAPKVMDFGIAKLPVGHLTSTGQFFGTPMYMSPEQASGEAVDGRSDIFSLGSTLYLLLTGRPAFEADTMPAILAWILHRDPPPPSAVVPGLPSSLDRITARALAKTPSQRYPDGKAFAQDLVDVAAGRESRHLVCAAVLPAPDPSALPVVTPLALPTREREAEARRPIPWPSGRIGRRGLLAFGGLAAAGVVAGLLALSRKDVRLLPAPWVAVPPARLDLDLKHSLKSGTLRVWIDDALVLEEPLESWVKEDLFVVKLRSGREKKTLEVAPGEREVRIQVTGDGFSGSRVVRGQFESGGARRLEANFGGLLKKELTVYWGS